MAESLIISVSGMRGVIGENLTPVIAAQYGCAFGTFLRDVAAGEDRRLRVCVGRDSRVSGQMLLSAITAGLCSVGVDVIDLGLVTTPCVGIMLRELGCDGGIVITASHNPLPYNGIKLLLSNGMAPPAPTAARIKQAFLDGQARYVDSVRCGTVSRNEETDRVHVDKVLATIDARRIAAKRYRIVLDSVNGAGARVAKKLLAELGCEVIAMNDEPTGLFAHGAEPIATNLVDLCLRVRQEKADLGFAQDPDADRLAIVDENGVYIGEEYTLALAAKYVFSKHGGTAAANLSTSRMIDDIAGRAGAKVLRTPVGEAHVANAMIEHGCVIGGEGNGGVIDLRVGPIRDSLVGMALVLQLMAETGKSVSGLVAEIGSYSMHKDKFSADSQQAQEIIKRSAQRFSNAEVNTADGLRLDFPDAWVHLRTSNTEPVMRIIVEAKNAPAAGRYIQAITEICRSVLEVGGADRKQTR